MKKARLIILEIPFDDKGQAGQFEDYKIICPLLSCRKIWWYRKNHLNIYKCSCGTYFNEMGSPFYSRQQLSEGGIFFQHKEDRTKVFIEDLELET